VHDIVAKKYRPKNISDDVSTFFPLLDFLRFAAAIGVFAAHADKYDVLPAPFGNACVQLFFALSGFLIGGILQKSDAVDVPRFYFNRSTRIWIPYGLAIFVLLAATLLKQGWPDWKMWEFFFYKTTFVYNWFGPPQLAEFKNRMPLDGTGNHFWSICVEEQFYLIAPFVLIYLKRSAIPLLLAIIMLNFFVVHDFTAICLGVLLAR
jgi:peptidoglycan/LPS O-acetylase OafA/YrhL